MIVHTFSDSHAVYELSDKYEIFRAAALVGEAHPTKICKVFVMVYSEPLTSEVHNDKLHSERTTEDDLDFFTADGRYDCSDVDCR